jgi:hypothetical protein
MICQEYALKERASDMRAGHVFPHFMSALVHALGLKLYSLFFGPPVFFLSYTSIYVFAHQSMIYYLCGICVGV